MRSKTRGTDWRDRFAASLPFKPDILLKWHRELVRRKWMFKQRKAGGPPSIAPELEAWIVRLARENPRL